MGDRKQARAARDEEFRSFLVGRWPRLMRTAFLLTGEQYAAEDLVKGAQASWFVALAPGEVGYQSADVTT